MNSGGFVPPWLKRVKYAGMGVDVPGEASSWGASSAACAATVECPMMLLGLKGRPKLSCNALASAVAASESPPMLEEIVLGADLIDIQNTLPDVSDDPLGIAFRLHIGRGQAKLTAANDG